MFEHIYIYIYHICVFEKETAHIVCSVGVRLMTDVTVLSSYFTYIILKRDNKYVWKIRHELLKHARIAHRLLGTSHSTIRAIPGIRNDIAWLKKKTKMNIYFVHPAQNYSFNNHRIRFNRTVSKIRCMLQCVLYSLDVFFKWIFFSLKQFTLKYRFQLK